MTIRHSFPGPDNVTPSTEARLAFSQLFVRDTSGNVRAGVLPRNTSALVSSRSDMKVDVAAFEGISNRSGAIMMANDGTTQVTVSTAPVSNSRLDVIYFRQNESGSPFSDGNDNAVLASQDGPVSASPTLAATLALLPVGAVPLASVLVPTGKTATNQSGVVITPIHAYAALAGTPIWVRNPTELAATSGYAAMNVYAIGQTAFDISTSIGYQWNGTAWVATAGLSSTGTPTLAGTITATSTYTTKLEKNGNIVNLSFAFTNSATTGTGTINTGTVIATLPVGFRPANPLTVFMGANNTAAVLIVYTIDSSGVIRAYPLAGLGAGSTLFGSTSFSVA